MITPKTFPKPTEAEYDILQILWNGGPATVRAVHDQLSQTKRSQYTTTLKLMQVLAEKGLVKRDETNRSHVYYPQITREQAQQRIAGHLLNRVFGGSAKSLLLGALGAKRTSKKELAELRQLLDEHERGSKR
jgi:BlaI family transcriptional regulator, penicillinase repressor